MKEAKAWVEERGGAAACARDVLVLTLGRANPLDIRAALEKAEAPPNVFDLIWVEIWKQTRGLSGKK